MSTHSVAAAPLDGALRWEQHNLDRSCGGGATERQASPAALLDLALECALSVTGARAIRLLITDAADASQCAVTERGADGAALALLASLSSGSLDIRAVIGDGRPCDVPVGDEAQAPNWQVVAVPVSTTAGDSIGLALLAKPTALPNAAGDAVVAGVGRQIGGAVEQVRWLEAERARAEEALRQAEAHAAVQTVQLQAIVAQAAEAIYACDRQGQIILANQPAARLFGLATVEEMLQPISALLNDVEIRAPTGIRLDALKLMLSRALTEGRAVAGEYAIRSRRTGEESFRRLSTAPLLAGDGTIQGSVTVATDISALIELQRLAEVEVEAAKHQRQRLQAIIDALADPICVFGPDWRVLLFNERLIQTLGLPADLLGRHATELDDLVPGRFVQMEAAERVTSLAERVRAAAVDEVTVGEPPRIFRRAASGVYDETGQPLAFIFLYHDITLVREVERLKDEFLAAVSHDLRSPLHHIKGYTSTLLRQDVDWNPELQRHFLSTIDRECDRMTHIVGNLLDLSRLEADSSWLHLQECDLGVIITAAVERARDGTNPHPIAVQLPPDLGTIAADARWIERLIVNLLDNAAKYSPDDSPISIRVWREVDSLVVAVEDQGIGIPAEHIEAIFHRFYRVSNTSRARGSGLGLAICRRIAEAHSGAIWVESEPERGSIFYVRLPDGGRS